MSCGGDVFQAMASERSIRAATYGLLTSHFARRPRENHLLAVGGSADAGSDDDVHAVCDELAGELRRMTGRLRQLDASRDARVEIPREGLCTIDAIGAGRSSMTVPSRDGIDDYAYAHATPCTLPPARRSLDIALNTLHQLSGGWML